MILPCALLFWSAAAAAAPVADAPEPPELAGLRARYERLRGEMERVLGELDARRVLLAPATLGRYEALLGPLCARATELDDEYNLLRDELKAFKTQYFIVQAAGVLDELGGKDAGLAAGARLAESAQLEHLARVIAEFRSEYNARRSGEREAYFGVRAEADRRATSRRFVAGIALSLLALGAALWRARWMAPAAACLVLLAAAPAARAQEAELARLQAEFAALERSAPAVLGELRELASEYERARAVSPFEERRGRMREDLWRFQTRLSALHGEAKQLRMIYHMGKFVHVLEAIGDERLRAGAELELDTAMRLEDLYKRLSVLKRELGAKAFDEDRSYERFRGMERSRRRLRASLAGAGGLCALGAWLLRRRLTRP